LEDEKKGAPAQLTSVPELRADGPLRMTAQAWLKGPSERATKIASLKGRLKMSYVVQRYVAFESPGDDQKLEYDGVTLELKNFKHDGDDVSFNLDISGRRRTAPPFETRWVYDGRMRIDGHKIALKAEGADECRPSEWSGGPTDEGWRMNFTFNAIKSKVTAISIEVDGILVEDVVDFEIKDIPFPK